MRTFSRRVLSPTLGLLLSIAPRLGCSSDSSDGSTPDVADGSTPDVTGAAVGPAPSALEGELQSDDWAFDYITAALGGSWTRWWSFGEDGKFVSTTETWVHENGVSTYPTTVASGTWTVGESRQVTATVSDAGLTRTWTFHAAVFDEGPRLITHPSPAMQGAGRFLSTRAFQPSSDGSWVDEHAVSVEGKPDDSVTTRTTVTITPPLTAAHESAPCTMRVTVAVTMGGAEAVETFEPPCVRLVDPATGWHAAGDLAKHIYRYDVVQAAGVFDRHPQAVADAIYAGLVLVLAVQEDQPGVAVHPVISEEALGWYGKASKTPPPASVQ